MQNCEFGIFVAQDKNAYACFKVIHGSTWHQNSLLNFIISIIVGAIFEGFFSFFRSAILNFRGQGNPKNQTFYSKN